jgi:hypothetical protein
LYVGQLTIMLVNVPRNSLLPMSLMIVIMVTDTRSTGVVSECMWRECIAYNIVSIDEVMNHLCRFNRVVSHVVTKLCVEFPLCV